MTGFHLFFIVVGLPTLTLALHEMTHLAAARTVSPVSVELGSYVPLRLQIDLSQRSSRYTVRLIALAPVLVGSLAAVIAVQSGFWQRVQSVDPYYIHHLVVVNWLMYIAPSSADLQLALWPQEKTT